MSARLKCLQTIIGANGVNKPGAEPTLEQLGIKTNEAEVLVRSGAAAWADPVAVADPAPAPAVTDTAPAVVEPAASGDTVEATLAGVVDADGSVRDLEEMKRAELVEIAEGMEIPRASGMNKQQLVDAIRAERVEIDPADAVGADAGAEG